MELDPLFLSRLQFAFVVSFHAIFPVFTIGLASYIAVLETIALRTASPHWERLAAFWIKGFAVVMFHQFRLIDKTRIGCRGGFACNNC